MDHPTALIGTLDPISRYQLLAHFNTRYGGARQRYAVKISATQAWCSRHGELHAASAIKVDLPDTTTKRIVNAAVAGLTAISRRFVYKPFGSVLLYTAIEQEALARRRIVLQGSRPVIHWDLSVTELEHLWRFSDHVTASLHRNGWLKRRPKVPSVEALRGLALDACHPMGGLRMGLDPRHSGVDSNLQLHDCPGIYVCTAAVYPSGSHSNPTMTLFALADRLAGHLLKPC
ncbi:MAG: GMC family oxidoreductase [Pirellulales bacterium]